jgi:hypothetical protein
MPAEKITVSLEEINSPAVDEKLRAAAQEEADFTPPPPPPVTAASVVSGLWYNTLVYASIFGLLGGLLGWAMGQIMFLRPDPWADAQPMITEYEEILASWSRGELEDDRTQRLLDDLRRRNRSNPYFRIHSAIDLKREIKDARIARLRAADAWRDWLAHVLFHSAAGLAIALCLAAAEPIVERNWPRAILNGSVGALIGVAGGALVGPIDRAVGWGIIGLFVGVAPGLMMLNPRRIAIGAAGGAIGGAVGGLLMGPVEAWTHSAHLARLTAVLALGLIAGLGSGLIEKAARQGWLKVTAGLIAGKQFVLYRNPTYIGNSLQCHIYLFKDPQVGRRHAAIHIVPGGFEIEDLPLGAPTYVDGRPVTRARLHNGDQIRIGSTMLLFQEKSG